MPDDPLPFYPELACHEAPLRPGHAPDGTCDCRICAWARGRAALERESNTVRPGTPAWDALLTQAGG